MAVAWPEENGCFIENPNTGAMMSGAQSRIHFRISTNSHDRALVISSALFQVVDKSHFEMTERPYKRIKCAQSTFFSVFLACIFNEKPCSRARPVSATQGFLVERDVSWRPIARPVTKLFFGLRLREVISVT